MKWLPSEKDSQKLTVAMQSDKDDDGERLREHQKETSIYLCLG